MTFINKNIVYKSSIIAENVHIGDIYHFYNQEINIPLDLTLLPIVYEDEVVGRDSDLSDLVAILDKTIKLISVRGDAGIGKTMLLRYLISRYRNDFNYVLWVNYGSSIKESFVNNFQLIDSLALHEELKNISRNKNYINLAFGIIINRLRLLKPSLKKSLLVFDNFDTDEFEMSELDSLQIGKDWRVILTSRNAIPWTEEFILKALNIVYAKQLFSKLYVLKLTNHSEDKIESILELIDFNTLLIELLAKTSRIINLDLDTLLKQLKKIGLGINGLVRIPIRHSKRVYATGVLQYVVSIFDFAKLNNEDLNLLIQISLMPSKFIPVKNDEESVFSILLIDDEKRSQFNNSLNNCFEKGLISVSDDGKLIKMHKLVQEAIQNSADYTYQNAKPIIEFLHKKFDTAPNYDLSNVKRWLDYVKPIIKLIDCIELVFVELLTRYSWFACEFELYEEGLFAGEKAIKLSRLLNLPKLEVACLSNTANLYSDLNRTEEAINLLRDAVDLAIAEYPPGHKEISLYRSNLAVAYRKKGDYEKAVQQLRMALTESRSTNFDQPELKVLFHHNLACVYNDMGKFEDAMIELESEGHLLKKYEYDIFRTAVWEFEFGRAYVGTGDKKNARLNLKNSRHKFIELFGEAHSRTQKTNALLKLL